VPTFPALFSQSAICPCVVTLVSTEGREPTLKRMLSSVLAATALIAGATLTASAPSAATAPARQTSRFGEPFTIASLNTLGASHTGARGSKHRWASGSIRTARAVRVLQRHQVDVVGLQEFQRQQATTFRRLAGGTFATFSAPGDTENTVAWRKDKFELVSGRTTAIPYFDGHARQMPVVRLRVRSTGQQLYVGTFHNPGDTRRFPHQARWRRVATTREVRLARRLDDTGLPVLVTGDMNEGKRYFCRLTAGTGMHSAFGGSHQNGCRPPAYGGVDWIFGNRLTQFAKPVVDRSSAVRRTTDHPVVLAEVDYAPGSDGAVRTTWSRRGR
jgi:endonuclease/exonuclease/phosphatase family metal-dependent hydrolase